MPGSESDSGSSSKRFRIDLRRNTVRNIDDGPLFHPPLDPPKNIKSALKPPSKRRKEPDYLMEFYSSGDERPRVPRPAKYCKKVLAPPTPVPLPPPPPPPPPPVVEKEQESDSEITTATEDDDEDLWSKKHHKPTKDEIKEREERRTQRFIEDLVTDSDDSDFVASKFVKPAVKQFRIPGIAQHKGPPSTSVFSEDMTTPRSPENQQPTKPPVEPVDEPMEEAVVEQPQEQPVEKPVEPPPIEKVFEVVEIDSEEDDYCEVMGVTKATTKPRNRRLIEIEDDSSIVLSDSPTPSREASVTRRPPTPSESLVDPDADVTEEKHIEDVEDDVEAVAAAAGAAPDDRDDDETPAEVHKISIVEKKRKKHLTEAEKLLVDEGAKKLLETTSTSRRSTIPMRGRGEQRKTKAKATTSSKAPKSTADLITSIASTSAAADSTELAASGASPKSTGRKKRLSESEKLQEDEGVKKMFEPIITTPPSSRRSLTPSQSRVKASVSPSPRRSTLAQRLADTFLSSTSTSTDTHGDEMVEITEDFVHLSTDVGVDGTKNSRRKKITEAEKLEQDEGVQKILTQPSSRRTLRHAREETTAKLETKPHDKKDEEMMEGEEERVKDEKANKEEKELEKKKEIDKKKTIDIDAELENFYSKYKQDLEVVNAKKKKEEDQARATLLKTLGLPTEEDNRAAALAVAAADVAAAAAAAAESSSRPSSRLSDRTPSKRGQAAAKSTKLDSPGEQGSSQIRMDDKDRPIEGVDSTDAFDDQQEMIYELPDEPMEEMDKHPKDLMMKSWMSDEMEQRDATTNDDALRFDEDIDLSEATSTRESAAPSSPFPFGEEEDEIDMEEKQMQAKRDRLAAITAEAFALLEKDLQRMQPEASTSRSNEGRDTTPSIIGTTITLRAFEGALYRDVSSRESGSNRFNKNLKLIDDRVYELFKAPKKGRIDVIVETEDGKPSQMLTIFNGKAYNHVKTSRKSSAAKKAPTKTQSDEKYPTWTRRARVQRPGSNRVERNDDDLQQERREKANTDAEHLADTVEDHLTLDEASGSAHRQGNDGDKHDFMERLQSTQEPDEEAMPLPPYLTENDLIKEWFERANSDEIMERYTEKEKNYVKNALIDLEQEIMIAKGVGKYNNQLDDPEVQEELMSDCFIAALETIDAERRSKETKALIEQYPEEYQKIMQADLELGIAIPSNDMKCEIYYTKGNEEEEKDVKKLLSYEAMAISGRPAVASMIQIKTPIFPEFYIGKSIIRDKMPNNWKELISRKKKNTIKTFCAIDPSDFEGFVRCMHRDNYISKGMDLVTILGGWTNNLMSATTVFDQVDRAVRRELVYSKSNKQLAEEEVLNARRRGRLNP